MGVVAKTAGDATRDDENGIVTPNWSSSQQQTVLEWIPRKLWSNPRRDKDPRKCR